MNNSKTGHRDRMKQIIPGIVAAICFILLIVALATESTLASKILLALFTVFFTGLATSPVRETVPMYRQTGSVAIGLVGTALILTGSNHPFVYAVVALGVAGLIDIGYQTLLAAR